MLPTPILHLKYEEAAQEYLRSLPPEHFMESIEQATQRKITLESMDLVRELRPEVQTFNELLILYPLDERGEPLGRVVPDNMVLIHESPIRTGNSFNLPLQPCGPFWVLEYVSKSNRRKDYEDNMDRYEKDLAVPYYLLFAPEEQEMTLFRMEGERYATVLPNEEGRCELPELELEIGLLDGWVRYWFRGKLLALPGKLLRELEAADEVIEQEREKAKKEKQRADRAERRAKKEKARAEEEKARADEEKASRLALQDQMAEMREELERLRKGKNGS